ncbi:hypothetical protein SAOR_00845 [Salinisphaera orenii MK-B5]|uniref:Phage portal protein n=1 Tax=Salinisphaera orenii MK-B5 TaxID=856730 RepID=A0A423PXU7_9GAMM|nr:phage portal protein [Salinisphaera orenii]ROO30418.1 hypothetical protein SAOR_00845 [Salinisphaera orenii MK-B5]
MSILDRFRRTKAPDETRNYTSQMMASRFVEITGQRGIADLTATVQGCISLWESGLSLADVNGTDALTPRDLTLMARQLGLKGESVFLMGDDRLIPVSQWDLKTRDGIPTAYRLTLPDVAGGRSFTALAGEVLHIRVGSTVEAPWRGTAPLMRASLTAGLLHAVESALSDVYADSPLGSQVVPMPEDPNISNEQLARSFRGQRGRVLLRESTAVTAAGGPAPTTDWRPSDLSPDLSRTMSTESMAAARQAILGVYGVLPSLMDAQAAGPSVREGQRHLAQWQLQPIATLIAQEASEKLGTAVSLDTLRPTQAYDAGGRARTLAGVIEGMAAAKEAGLSDEQVTAALNFAGITDRAYP